MIATSEQYKEWIQATVRNPFVMEVTFHYPSGDVVYDNIDERSLIEFTESKSAHLVSGELPMIDVTITLKNLDGIFDPNDISGLHDMLVKGVMITYKYGYLLPKIKPYGYAGEVGEEYDPVFGLRDTDTPQFEYDGELIPAEAFGFIGDYDIEWLDGGEVISDGTIDYDEQTVTIGARDFLSTMEEGIWFNHGQKTLAELARMVLEQTEYPRDNEGKLKVITGIELDNHWTFTEIAPTPEDTLSPKEWLQTIAHAGNVQFYIDRWGYLHLDNDKVGLDTGYEITNVVQKEKPKHSKEQIPRTLLVELNDEISDPISLVVGGSGDDMTIENPYIVLTSEAEAMRDWVMEQFVPYRNVAEIGWRADPSLDVLDEVNLYTKFKEEAVKAIIVGTEITFNGTLSGTLHLRYDYGENVTSTVKIVGGGVFTFPLGKDIPTQENMTLTCVTENVTSPTYEWYYYTASDNKWHQFVGETTSILTIDYDGSYFNYDTSVKVKVVVNDRLSAVTTVRYNVITKATVPQYKGIVKVTDPAEIKNEVPSPVAGDVILFDNTEDDSDVDYGETYMFNGIDWEPTQDSGALSVSYADALQLAKSSGKTIITAEIYADLIVTRNLIVGDGTGEEGSGFRFRAIDREGSPVVDVYDGDIKIFEIDSTSKNIIIGNYAGGSGILWNNAQKKMYIAGHVDAESGSIKGQLDTATLLTLYGGDTEYPKGNQTTINALLSSLVDTTPPNTTTVATGTINGKQIQSVRYGDINVQYNRQSRSSHIIFNTYYYRYVSATISTVEIQFVMEDSTTYTYVLRKIRAKCQWANSPPPYPDYLPPPASYTTMMTQDDYYYEDSHEHNNLLPSEYRESDFNGVLPLRAFPYPVMSLSVWEAMSERLFIKLLPTSKPSETNRVWNDNGTLKIVT